MGEFDLAIGASKAWAFGPTPSKAIGYRGWVAMEAGTAVLLEMTMQVIVG